jgi:hypothetical protein
MTAGSDARWATVVRVLALTSTLLLVIAVLEGCAIRRARSELQQLRSDADRGRSALVSDWTRQSVDEAGDAVKWLDDFYRDPADGFGRAGGLCPGGTLDERALTGNVFGVFLPARAAGKSMDASLQDMKDALTNSDAYRARRPR